MHRTMIAAVLLLLCAGVTAAQSPPDFGIERFTWQVEVGPEVPVDVTNPHGDVRIRAGVGTTVEVSAAIQRQHSDPVVAPVVAAIRDGVVRIGVAYPGTPRPDLVRRVDLVVFVPIRARVSIRTLAGMVVVKGLDGDVDVETGSGQVLVQATSRLDVRTRGGSVELRLPASVGWDGPSQVRTESGEVRLLVADEDAPEVVAETSGMLSSDLPSSLSHDPATGRAVLRVPGASGAPRLEVDSQVGDVVVMRRR